MRKLLVIVFSSIFFCSFAEDVELRNLGKHTGDRLETPVDADFTDNTLSIFVNAYGYMARFYAHVTVTGPEGVVYETDINSDNRPAVIVNLNKYMKGGYTVTFYDRDGNVLCRCCASVHQRGARHLRSRRFPLRSLLEAFDCQTSTYIVSHDLRRNILYIELTLI